MAVRGVGRRVGVCTIYHSPQTLTDVPVPPAADVFGMPVRYGAAVDLFARTRPVRDPAVLIVDASLLHLVPSLDALPDHVIVVAADADAEAALGDHADLSMSNLPDIAARQRVLRAACQFSTARVTARRRKRDLTCTRHDLHELNAIGISLMHEHDQEVLLRRIVEQGKFLTESDGGCLFLLERAKEYGTRLRPAVWVIDSIPDLQSMMKAFPPPLPFDSSSIIGYTAMTKHHVVVDDAYNIPRDAPYQSNIDFEKEFGYYVKSLLTLPMIDRRDNVIGILVFVNRKRSQEARVRDKATADRWVVPYARREIRLGRALASIAATSIENSTLYAQIEHIFESFVKAAVSAIDQRDPSTAGHSVRVATLTTELARATERARIGRYRDLHFSRDQMRELRFAALLHDLGKVGVREDVLMKAKKLPPQLWERVVARFDLIRRTLEADHYRQCGPEPTRCQESMVHANGDLDVGCATRWAELERYWRIIRAANEPVPLPCTRAELEHIARHSFQGPDHEATPYLTPEELRYLEIPHGSLDPHEREEIESHVEQTYQFLRQIPWTDDLRNLAWYAYGHHERLDGTGYPRGVKGDEIPVQTRIMTIADIYDALTAADRPYRHAVTPERALDMLLQEVKTGGLDADLVHVFVESQVYRQVEPH